MLKLCIQQDHTHSCSQYEGVIIHSLLAHWRRPIPLNCEKETDQINSIKILTGSFISLNWLEKSIAFTPSIMVRNCTPITIHVCLIYWSLSQPTKYFALIEWRQSSIETSTYIQYTKFHSWSEHQNGSHWLRFFHHACSLAYLVLKSIFKMTDSFIPKFANQTTTQHRNEWTQPPPRPYMLGCMSDVSIYIYIKIKLGV